MRPYHSGGEVEEGGEVREARPYQSVGVLFMGCFGLDEDVVSYSEVEMST